MEEFSLKDEYIKLGQLLKAAGLAENGAEAKIAVQDGQVRLNGEICTMRGKKVRKGDIVEFDGQSVRVI